MKNLWRSGKEKDDKLEVKFYDTVEENVVPEETVEENVVPEEIIDELFADRS